MGARPQERASQLDGPTEQWMARLEERLSDIVSRGPVPVPPYPAVALRVQERLRDDAGLAELARVVGADAALAADVLRCANSAFYRRSDAVTTLAQAITRIGTQQLSRLTLASGLATSAHAFGPLAPLRRRYWIEGLASAAVCQELARLRRLPAEEAFLLGLLHDFGKVVAVACLEWLADGLPGRARAPAALYDELIERHHVAIGVAVARRWKLPEPLGAVIAAHHGEGTASDPGLLATVVASDNVVALLDRVPAVMAADVARLPGLHGLDEVDAMRRLAVQIPEFVAAFEPASPDREAARPCVARPPPRAVHPLGSSFPVRATIARRTYEYRATALDGRALVIEGRDPLPENRLVEATLLCAPAPFTFWALPRGMASPATGSVCIELKPYALDGGAQARWAALAGGPAA